MIVWVAKLACQSFNRYIFKLAIDVIKPTSDFGESLQPVAYMHGQHMHIAHGPSAIQQHNHQLTCALSILILLTSTMINFNFYSDFWTLSTKPTLDLWAMFQAYTVHAEKVFYQMNINSFIQEGIRELPWTSFLDYFFLTNELLF